MFSSIDKYNGVLAFKKLYCGPSNKHGFGIFTLRQLKPGDVIVSDNCIVFAQDSMSYRNMRVCPLCTREGPCDCGSITKYAEALHISEFRDVDPRLIAALDILHLDLEIYHRRKYSEIFPEWRGCIEQLATVSRVPVTTLDELAGLLRVDSVDVDVHSNCMDTSLSQRELLHLWLQMGEVPDQESLERRELPPIRGSALCVVASMINHDCDPNVEFIWSRDETDGHLILEITALKYIPVGQELLSCYSSSGDDLTNLFGFVCRCSLCQTGRTEHALRKY